MEAHITWGILWIISAIFLPWLAFVVPTAIGTAVAEEYDAPGGVVVGFLVGLAGSIAWVVFSVAQSVNSWVALAGG